MNEIEEESSYTPYCKECTAWTPKEMSEKLILKYYFMLPNNGLQTGIVSIPVRWKESIQCAIVTVDSIMDFMKIDDELNDDTHFANSNWVNYWQEVKKELQIQLDKTNNEDTTTTPTKR